MQIVTVAFEHRVRLDMDLDIEVARRAAVDAGFAVAGRADPHAFVDAGRDLDLEGLLRLDLALAVAFDARLGDVLAGAVALRASLLHREEALRHADLADAFTSGAGLDVRARLGAVAVAVIAVVPVRYADLRLVAVRGLLERDLHAVAQVGAAIDLRTAALPAPGCLAKDVAEDIAEGLGEAAVALGTAEAARHVRVHARVPVLVVGRLLFGVGEHLVGLLGLLEFLLRILAVRIAVRVVLHRELAIRLLDVVVARVLAHPEHFVVVTFCHGGSNPDWPTRAHMRAGRRIAKSRAGKSDGAGPQVRAWSDIRRPASGLAWRRRKARAIPCPSHYFLSLTSLNSASTTLSSCGCASCAPPAAPAPAPAPAAPDSPALACMSA